MMIEQQRALLGHWVGMLAWAARSGWYKEPQPEVPSILRKITVEKG